MNKTDAKSVDAYAECAVCPARPGCPAGCYHNNRATTGDANKPPRAWCEMRRRMIPVVLEIDREIGK
ncbi:MAG TPA: hypothetical protein PLK04_10665, partial [Bacillota bacterium]|nr:hypothetical protein [Bacillota bacterium]